MSEDDNVAQELSGLQWLKRERPEAVEHLLAFFAASSRHLEPKTRFLISVVTKVVNFTPRGLRQYIPRAMREGASRDEILDAILCAYPAAGLTKVVDAVDILRTISDPVSPTIDNDGSACGARALTEAGEPSAQQESGSTRPDASTVWHAAVALVSLRPGVGRRISVAGKELALFRVEDEVHAVANACVHLGGELAGGRLSGTVVTCPLHGWEFDVADGHCLTREDLPLQTYRTEVCDGVVGVFL